MDERAGVDEMSNYELLTSLGVDAWNCTACSLSQTRNCAVPGKGSAQARILFVGEGPGAEEDKDGRPFVGRAGKLLDEGLEQSGLDRDDVFFTNMVKCRPPGNRNPTTEEMEACSGFLRTQIDILKPALIVTLGKVAAEFLLGRNVYITRENGHLDFLEDGTCIMTVLHPAYVLRNQTEEVRESFFQAIEDAKAIAMGRPSLVR